MTEMDRTFCGSRIHNSLRKVEIQECHGTVTRRIQGILKPLLLVHRFDSHLCVEWQFKKETWDDILERHFWSRFLDINCSLLGLEFLSGFLPSLFRSTKYISWIDSSFKGFGGRMPLFFVYFSHFITFIHTFIQSHSSVTIRRGFSPSPHRL